MMNQYQPNPMNLPSKPSFHVNYDDVMAEIIRKVDQKLVKMDPVGKSILKYSLKVNDHSANVQIKIDKNNHLYVANAKVTEIQNGLEKVVDYVYQNGEIRKLQPKKSLFNRIFDC